MTLDEAVRFSIPGEPGCPDLHRHSRLVSSAAATTRVCQEITEPPCAAAIGKAEPDEPDFITASGRESGVNLIESLHGATNPCGSVLSYAPSGIESFSSSVVGLGRGAGVAGEGAVESGIMRMVAVGLDTVGARLTFGRTLLFGGA